VIELERNRYHSWRNEKAQFCCRKSVAALFDKGPAAAASITGAKQARAAEVAQRNMLKGKRGPVPPETWLGQAGRLFRAPVRSSSSVHELKN